MRSARFAFLGRLFRHQRRFFLWDAVRPSVLEFDFSPITEKHPCGCFFQREKGLIRSPSPLCVGSFTLRARQLRGQVPPSLFALALPVRKLRRSNPLFGFGPFPQQTEKHPCGCFFSAGKGTDLLAVSALRRLVHPSGSPASRSSPSVAFRTRVARA